MIELPSEEGKRTAIIAYITIIGTVVALFMNNEKKDGFASFHIRQALGIFLMFFLLGYIIGNFDSWTVTMAWYIFIMVLWFYGFIGAIQGRRTLVPLVGELFQKIFKST